MRLLWKKAPTAQLDLLEAKPRRLAAILGCFFDARRRCDRTASARATRVHGRCGLAAVHPFIPIGKAAGRTDALARAHAACGRLERALARIDGPPPYTVALPELVALRIRVEDITRKWPWGSDR
jgi:hypothetical protein